MLGADKGRNRDRAAIVAATAALLSGLLLAAPSALEAQLFVEVSDIAGLADYISATEGMASGAAAADYDGDGFVDIYVPTAETTPNRLYHNLGNGTFEEVALLAGVTSPGVSRAALWFDYDGDYDLDLLVGGDCRGAICVAGESALRLYRQNADHTFTDVTVAAGLFEDASLLETDGMFAPHRAALSAGDLDNDGDLDLFTGMWGLASNGVYFNQGGTFIDGSAASGASTPDDHWQSVMHDFNGDGWLDIFVAIDFAPNHLWINQQDGTFCDAAPRLGLDGAFNEMGVALGDPDGDGDFDIYVTNIFRQGKYNRFYRNKSIPGSAADWCTGPGHPGTFIDDAAAVGMDDTGWGWGTTWLDGDNEGLVDLAATNGFGPPPWNNDQSRYFENQGTAPMTFIDTSGPVGFDDTYWGSALLAFDYDRDGDLDLMQSGVHRDDPVPLRLLENRLGLTTEAGNHYLNVRPRMAGPNSHAIGSVIELRVDQSQQMRLITAGTSLLGQEPAEAYFGLGSALSADKLTVRWPDGVESQFANLDGDELLTVRRGSPADLMVTIDDGVGEQPAPGALTYTVEVANLGAGSVTGADLDVVLPAGPACGGWSCSPAGGWCTKTPPAGNLTDQVDLLAGGTVVYSVECTVPAESLGDELIATATVGGPSESPDPSPSDNTDADSTVVIGSGIGGWITGFGGNTVCTNKTVPQSVNVPIVGGFSNCTDGGLVAASGDRLRQRSKGTATADPVTAYGYGLSPTRGICRNITTAQTIVVNPFTDSLLDCAAAGLVASPGDQVIVTVIGTAD